MPQVARAIEAALARLEPRDASVFAAGLAAFDASLRSIEAVLGQIRRRYPGAPVAYTERVPGYLLAAAGLRVLTPPGFAAAIEDGSDPSPDDTVVMDRLFTGYRVRCCLQRPGGERGDPAGAGPGPLLRIPVVGVTETMPPSYRSYQAWQLAQARALLHALGG